MLSIRPGSAVASALAGMSSARTISLLLLLSST